MAAAQEFAISNGEWVCAGCGAGMVMPEDAEHGVQAPRRVTMNHEPGCSQLAALRA